MTKTTFLILVCLWLGGCNKPMPTLPPSMVRMGDREEAWCSMNGGPWFPARKGGMCYAEDRPR